MTVNYKPHPSAEKNQLITVEEYLAYFYQNVKDLEKDLEKYRQQITVFREELRRRGIRQVYKQSPRPTLPDKLRPAQESADWRCDDIQRLLNDLVNKDWIVIDEE